MKFVPIPILATVELALSACGTIKTDDETGEDTEEVDMTPEGPSVASRLFGGGEPMPLDIQVAHPNKTVVQLTSLQVKPSGTVIHAIISNGRDREIELNSNNQDNTYIVTGDGQKLFLSAPPTNSNLTIQPGQRIEADVVFLGELPKGSDATLMINDGNQTSNQYTSNPGFRIIPPVRDAAFSDDGSKKKLSSLSNGRQVSTSSMRKAATGGAATGSAVSSSTLSEVEQLRSELGAEQTARGTVVALPGDVLFDFDKAEIRASARPTLDKLAQLIVADDGKTVAIEGHTDSKGVEVVIAD